MTTTADFEVEIGLGVRSAERRFRLEVRFRTAGRRTLIVGPSGAGKSLTLQTLAGLRRPDTGRILFRGEPLFDAARGIDVPARRRGFGYLFQDDALFPHLDVRQNIAFGLSRGWRNPARRGAGRGVGAGDAKVVDRWLERFELEAVAGQRPAELSGGQRQRTALARALANEPRALLLDEPFAALDPALRSRMRRELDALLDRVDLPVVLVTHDPADLDRYDGAPVRLFDGRGGSA